MTARSGYDPLGLGAPAGAAPRPEPRVRLAAPPVGDEEADAVRAVLASGFLTNGPAVRAFEDAFATRHGVAHAVAMANGTVALAAMYLALGIGPGDEVVVPSLTFISTATSVLHVGATPVFAEVLPGTFDLDAADVARRVTGRTRAIVAVHYGGQPADMDALRTVADDAGVVLLEDAAQAHGAAYRGRPAGSLGTMGMFSFTPTKNITMGEGGVVTTDDDELDRTLRLLRNHGQSAQYHHTMLGWNWRLTDIQAAIGSVQLGRLDGILATKRANAERFGPLLSVIDGVTPPVVAPGREHPFMLYALTLAPGIDRDAVQAHLVAAGIEARFYFPPAHQQPVFAGDGATLPVTEDLADRMLSLPFHAALTHDDMDLMAAELAVAVQRHRR